MLSGVFVISYYAHRILNNILYKVVYGYMGVR